MTQSRHPGFPLCGAAPSKVCGRFHLRHFRSIGYGRPVLTFLRDPALIK